MTETATPLFFLIAGEASGDLLGARLIKALKKKTKGNARFVGIGGERMIAEGLELFFQQQELAHVGLFEVMRHVPHIVNRINQTVAEVKRLKPVAVVTIDSPDFCFRVAKKLKAAGSKAALIHYVAPSVWAWRPGRAGKIARFLDHLLALLPFEPPYFTAEDLPCTFVGHPIVESAAGRGQGLLFRSRYNVPPDATLLVVLPGSRMSEVKRLLPIFAATVVWLRAEWPKLYIVIPSITAVADVVRKAVKHWPVPVVVTTTDEDKYDAMAAAQAALACSGTVSIELALAGLPGVIAYKINCLTYLLYRRLIKVKYVTLANIMQNRVVMPELLQHDCTPEKLAAATHELLRDPVARDRQRADLAAVADWLGRNQFVPSERAAQVILDTIALKNRL